MTEPTFTEMPDRWTKFRFASDRLMQFWRILVAWQPLLWCVATLASMLIVPLRYDIGQNSDGLLQTLISLQHLTFFFWQQNRFANLLPWMASFVADPTANASFQLALRIGLGVAAPLLFCMPGVRNGDALGAGRATLLATALALAFAPQRFIQEWFIEASPYGTSFALGGFALVLFSFARSAARGSAFVFRLAGLTLTIAAYTVNVSLVLFTAPLFAMQAVLFGSALAFEFAVASAVAGLVVALAVMAADVPNTSMRFGETTIGVIHYLGELTRKPGIFLAAMAALFLVAVLMNLIIARPGRRDSIGYGIVLLGTFVIGFLGISLSSWVVLNYLHPRYLVPLYILMSALGAISVIQVANSMATLLICAALLIFAGGRGLAPIPHDNSIVAAAVRLPAALVANAVTQGHLDGVAGDYWTVWPSVFLAEQQAHELGFGPGHIFGVTLRGDARREALKLRLLSQGHLDIACIDVSAEKCRDLTASILDQPVDIMRSLAAQQPLVDDHTLSILRLGASVVQ